MNSPKLIRNMRKEFKAFIAELSKEEYQILQKLVDSGKFRTKIAVIRALLREAETR